MRFLKLISAILFTVPLMPADTLVLDLTPSTLNVLPGGMIEFVGTLTNPGPDDVFLNGDVISQIYTALTASDAPFFADAPLFLPGGGSYTGPFFDVTADPKTNFGQYSGSFTIQGGADGNTFDNVATANFTVTVGAVVTPEPTSIPMMFIAFLVVCCVLRGSGARRKINAQ